MDTSNLSNLLYRSCRDIRIVTLPVGAAATGFFAYHYYHRTNDVILPHLLLGIASGIFSLGVGVGAHLAYKVYQNKLEQIQDVKQMNSEIESELEQKLSSDT